MLDGDGVIGVLLLLLLLVLLFALSFDVKNWSSGDDRGDLLDDFIVISLLLDSEYNPSLMSSADTAMQRENVYITTRVYWLFEELRIVVETTVLSQKQLLYLSDDSNTPSYTTTE